MKTECLTAEEAIGRGLKLPYALIRSLSSVFLGHTPGSVDASELLEARFFNEAQEIRLFRRDGALEGAALVQEAGDRYFEEIYKTARQNAAVAVRNDLSVDDDGQTYVSSTRLAGWEEMEHIG